MTNMQKYAPPLCCWCHCALLVLGSDLDGCNTSPAATILQWHPLWLRLWRLILSQHWTKIRPTFTLPMPVSPSCVSRISAHHFWNCREL